jgi:hypothetical protein
MDTDTPRDPLIASLDPEESMWRSIPGVLVAVLAVAALGLGATLHVSREAARADARIVAAAVSFLDSLDDEARTRAVRPFEHQERFVFHFTPVARTGLPLRDMALEQRSAALALLQSVTSTQGFLKATGVMRLEEILGQLENRPDRRDPENYHVWIFGSPSVDRPWGWRFEGHHLSLNFTSVDGVTVSTPSFMGANPALVPSGPHAGWRLLANEEDLARALVRSLNDAQRARAIIADATPRDIVTGNDRHARLERVEGLPVRDMTAEQRQIFMRLLSEYVDNADPEIARPRYARIEEVGIEELHFAWAGSVDVGEAHYYRIHGPTVLIEYDNTQNDANHIHSVWRDLENDFGEDLLRRHYETAGHDHGHDPPHHHSLDHGHKNASGRGPAQDHGHGHDHQHE